MSRVLIELQKTLADRKALLSSDTDAAAKSYVAQLHQKGLNKILEKVGENAQRLYWLRRMLQHMDMLMLFMKRLIYGFIQWSCSLI